MDITTLLLFLGLLEGGGGVAPTPGPGPSPTPGPGPIPPTPVYPPTPGPPPPSPPPFVPPPPGVLPQPHILPIKPSPPFPTPVQPQGLPPFPGPQWTPCATTAVITARALYWNPILWNYASKTIRQPTAQEQLGGQWVTFKAAWHPDASGNPQGLMATEAYCLGAAPGPSPGPSPGPTPEHPGVNYSYTGQPQDPATIAEWGNKLASVDAYDINNAWIVRMWEWAAGLTQAGYPGVDSVTPSGTDGRYGHDANAALVSNGIANPQPVAPTRPSWWGPPGTYTNPGEPAAPPGGIPPEAPVSVMMRSNAPMPHLATIRMAPAKK